MDNNSNQCNRSETEATIPIQSGWVDKPVEGYAHIYSDGTNVSILFYYCPLKVSEQRDIHPQCCCNGIADDFSEGKPLS